MNKSVIDNIKYLKNNFSGEIFTDKSSLLIYATDASVYREIPLAVAIPKNKDDIKKLVKFAAENKTSLIPRTAGTSLAGQVVGSGIVVDVSKYFTKIKEINTNHRYAIIEPAVVRDDLNNILEQHNLHFAPETSTSNRCMIGGMVGNNSCGAHSLIYGSTREHLISLKVILSDGSEVEFKDLDKNEFNNKTKGVRLENKLYKNINKILSDKSNQESIKEEFPDKQIKRRNTGYAIDILSETSPFTETEIPFNFAKLIAGSEGTLAFITEIKIKLLPKPKMEEAVVCVHLNSVNEAIRANLIALKHNPDSVELIDDTIISLSKDNIAQQKNRSFIKGEPGAILIVEFRRTTKENILEAVAEMQTEMQSKNFGYHFPVIWDKDINKVWAIRKAGLGLFSNMKGDAKPVPVIEDTAIVPELLPDYIEEFQQILDKHKLKSVYYAHIDTGELHLRPILNLKTKQGQELFHTIALEIAKLVKKYNGSLSGEHGDGRLRGEFIPLVLGENNYKLFKEIKQTWDPNNIFNPNKIIDTPKMNTSLRYKADAPKKEIDTIFDFSDNGGILETAEKCNGSGDCRKTHMSSGTMCPSYQASRNENQTTRARANILREFLTNSDKENPFDHKEIYEIMDLCLSCKACKSECPSNVDVTKLKAEFLQHYYDENGIPFRTKLIAFLPRINKNIYPFRLIANAFITTRLFNNLIGFTHKRKLPKLAKISLNKYYKKLNSNEGKNGTVYLFNDEFTNFNDSDIGIKAIQLLNKLGYKVIIPTHLESGRTYLSKGLVRKAKGIINQNINLLKDIITENTPLVGIEPSAILSFRDEYLDLADNKQDAQKLSKYTFTIDEFISNEIDKGIISSDSFTIENKEIKLHGHCQQKAIASTVQIIKMLSLPDNYFVSEIPSGCCGMAGSFGYEKEHYDLSMKIGELVLFPAIKRSKPETIIVASGTSCRCQINDGTEKIAQHPVEVLFDALI